MMRIDRQQLLGVLITLATVAFLMAVAPGFRYRAQARRAAIAIYAVVFVGIAAWVVLWLLGVSF
jgi:hypothetical protein